LTAARQNNDKFSFQAQASLRQAENWHMKGFLAALARLACERGQTMAEYGILIAVIAVVVVIAALTLGGSISHLFNSTAGKL
jgi:pilus assembly protein Flp/PilA